MAEGTKEKIDALRKTVDPAIAAKDTNGDGQFTKQELISFLSAMNS